MSLLSIVASSSAFLLPSSPPPKGSSIDSDWSIKNKKQPGFLRLISAWYAMVSLQFSHDDSASLPGLDPESRAPVRCSANQTAREHQPCQRSASCKLACWRTFGGQPNRIRVGKGSGDVSETSGARPESTTVSLVPPRLEQRGRSLGKLLPVSDAPEPGDRLCPRGPPRSRRGRGPHRLGAAVGSCGGPVRRTASARRFLLWHRRGARNLALPHARVPMAPRPGGRTLRRPLGRPRARGDGSD